MARILCIGITTLDIINEVQHYPHEDDEIRILSQDKRRGGNASNTAVVLSQLGHKCHWAGTLVHEADAQSILSDFENYRINIEHCQFLNTGKIPTSYITISQNTGSRTISHYRDLPEYSFQAFKKINLDKFDWLHFEGRNIKQTLKMMQWCKNKYPHIPLSVEIEKPRKKIKQLIKPADIILFSQHYAHVKGFNSAKVLCQHMVTKYPTKTIICAWGNSGAGASIGKKYYWQDALKLNAVDTLAAGDVFNAGIIHSLCQQQIIEKTLSFACQLAGKKCAQKGIDVVTIQLD